MTRRRKIAFRVVMMRQGEPVSGHTSQIYEIEGEPPFRVFYVEVGMLPSGEARERLVKVKERVAECRPDGWGPDLVLPVVSGSPAVRLDVWEELDEPVDPPVGLLRKNELRQLLSCVYAELDRHEITVPADVRRAVYDTVWEDYKG